MNRQLLLLVSFITILTCGASVAQQLMWPSGVNKTAAGTIQGNYFISDAKAYATNNWNICPDGSGGAERLSSYDARFERIL